METGKSLVLSCCGPSPVVERLQAALRLYESMGFEHQPSIKPDSHYDRANVYMVWRDPQSAPSAP